MTTQQLIDENLDLVKYRSMAAASRFGDEYGEYLTSGYIGLREAAERFDPNRGVQFRTFAQSRVDGAILDQVRKYHGRKGGRRYKGQNQTKSLDAMMEKDDFLHSDDFVCAKPIDEVEERDAFKALLRGLDRASQLVLTLYFAEGMEMTECGEAAGFSQSRTSQIIKYAKRFIQSKLSKAN